MIKRLITLALPGLVALIAMAGCSKDDPVQVERYNAQMSEAGLAGQSVSEFVIALTGEQAGVTTAASGTATLTLGKSSIEFRVEVFAIGTRVQSAGLYLGLPGVQGSRVATFFLGNQPGPIDGILNEGVVLADDLQGATFASVVDSMRAGQAYVLVGTVAEPDGEIRGQTGPRGEARFALSGSTMTWVVDGQIISGVTAITLHSGREGINGPLRVSMFEGGPTGEIDGKIADGEFGSGDIDGLTLSELIAEMQNGEAYVLISTEDHPDGRMRGQLYLQF